MTRIQCPSEAWDDYCEQEERKHCPTDDEMIDQCDAYGHLSFVVGFSDEWTEDKVCDCPTVYKGGKVTEKPVFVCDEDKGPACKKCGGRENRGDWLACFDYHVYTDPDCVTKLAYHVVVNSDSGGFIDTLETGCITFNPEDPDAMMEALKQVPYSLPDYWTSIGMEHGTVWLEAETKDADKCQEKWKAALKKDLEFHLPDIWTKHIRNA
ncbi:MAG: hypothetical protein CME17_05025 [Gemmatimonadetes bacterium]|nr:hypothetical protein [Gemmatimonadota bacterium]